MCQKPKTVTVDKLQEIETPFDNDYLMIYDISEPKIVKLKKIRYSNLIKINNILEKKLNEINEICITNTEEIKKKQISINIL